MGRSAAPPLSETKQHNHLITGGNAAPAHKVHTIIVFLKFITSVDLSPLPLAPFVLLQEQKVFFLYPSIGSRSANVHVSVTYTNSNAT